jgi:hypothetical protein
MKSISKQSGEWGIDLKLKVFLRFILILSYVFLLIVKGIKVRRREEKQYG